MHRSSAGCTAADGATGRHVDLPCRRGGLCFTYAPHPFRVTTGWMIGSARMRNWRRSARQQASRRGARSPWRSNLAPHDPTRRTKTQEGSSRVGTAAAGRLVASLARSQPSARPVLPTPVVWLASLAWKHDISPCVSNVADRTDTPIPFEKVSDVASDRCRTATDWASNVKSTGAPLPRHARAVATVDAGANAAAAVGVVAANVKVLNAARCAHA